jgi:lysozyme
MKWPIITAGVELIKEFEGFREHAYIDIAGVPTIGWGFTDGVKPGDRMTRDEGDKRLARELAVYTAEVREMCEVAPNSYQLAALVSCAWNIGVEGLRGSSIIKAHNRGDNTAAARAFGLWNKARIRGVLQPVAGLTRRRNAEAALYLTPIDNSEEMPQAVAPPKPMALSTTQIAAGAAATSALLDPVIRAVKQLDELKAVVAPMAAYILPALTVIGVIACAWIVWERWKHRRDGNA